MDIIRTGELIDKEVEVSPVAGGDLLPLRGEDAKVTGEIHRFGQTVGLEVKTKKGTQYGSMKDFFTNRCVLEDIQPPTATSASLKGALVHWSQPRTYWGERLDGLEALCFQLASATPRAKIEATPGGWRFLVPEPFPGRVTVVDCAARKHGKYWSLTTCVYPDEIEVEADLIESHWGRTFIWMAKVAQILLDQGFDVEDAYQDLMRRSRESATILRPLFFNTLARCAAEAEDAPPFPPGCLTVAFSEVRLKAGTIGLVEPPSDRRAYTVVSISPTALKKPEYMKQVILHECIHLVVASEGGEPHGEEFTALADKLGLKPEHRD